MLLNHNPLAGSNLPLPGSAAGQAQQAPLFPSEGQRQRLGGDEAPKKAPEIDAEEEEIRRQIAVKKAEDAEKQRVAEQKEKEKRETREAERLEKERKKELATTKANVWANGFQKELSKVISTTQYVLQD